MPIGTDTTASDYSIDVVASVRCVLVFYRGAFLSLMAGVSLPCKPPGATLLNTPIAGRDYVTGTMLALSLYAAVSQLQPVGAASLATQSMPGTDHLQPRLAAPPCPGAPCRPAAPAA